MKSRAQNVQHGTEKTVGGATIFRGKILEGTIMDERSYQSDYYVPCACGSGGGCGGGYDRTMRR